MGIEGYTGGMLQNTPYGFLATSWHFTLGLGNLLNEGIRSYIQVSYDFIQDFNRKPVLMGPPSPFPLFLLPHLMDTLLVWYRWIGIFKGHLGVVVMWRTDHFPRTTSAFTGTWPPTHIVNISPLYPRSPPFGPFPFHYSSSMTVLHRFCVFWRWF